MKEYIVTLHKHEDLDSFYEDMETPGGNLYIPDRAVEVANRRPISRNTHYWLTAEEAVQLKNDSRVWDVSLTPEELGLVPVPGWTDTNGYYSKDVVTTANDKNWGLLRGFDRDHVSGWGSDGATKVRTSTLNSKLNGTNVDFVIRGYTVDSAAPEFAVNADGTGGSRYFYVNWGDYGLGSIYTQAALTNDRSGAHETICGSIAFGNTQGWARKARFTSIPNITTYYDYVRAWHQAKSVNPDTGFKNPTVVTDSYGGNYGIDATAITSITYRGTTYNGPFTTSTDFSQYKLWLNNSGETLYNQPNGRVVFSYTSVANRADIEDLVAAGVIYVGVSHNWRAYHAVENDQDWNNSITFGGGTFYYNQGLFASATGAIQVGAIMDLAGNTPSPRSGRGPRVNIWAPSRTTGYSFYAGETPDGTGLGYEGGVQTDPASQGYLPMIKNSRDPRNSNYYIVKTTDGTSFSAPQVAGVIGLWAELKPDLTPAQALTLLQTYGDSTGVVSTSANYGDPTSIAGATALALGFSPPTFSITANKSSLQPTDVITYTISTTNVPTGSTLYLVESGTSIAGDFVDGLTQIAVTTTGDTTTVSRTVSGTFTGSKTSILQVKTGGYNGTVQVTSSTVNIVTLDISPNTLNDNNQGSYYSQTISSTGGSAPYTYSLISGSLPNGLTLNSSTGVISGTSTTDGSFNFTIRSTDSNSLSISKAYSIRVDPVFTITISPSTINNGGQTLFYSQTLTSSGGSGGYTYSITSGSLPNGLSLNSSTGVISGTPSGSGTNVFTIRSLDNTGNFSFRTYSLYISPVTITLNPAILNNAGQGTSFSQTFTASGGSGIYTFTISSGSLPIGLTLNSKTGILSGTPGNYGTFNFSIRATDSSGFFVDNAYNFKVIRSGISSSTELRTSQQIIRKNRDFTDLDLSFRKNNFTNDIVKKIDIESIKASVKHLILTKNYERPFHPEIGCQLHSLMFENFTPTIKIAMERTIYETIEKFEPRAKILDISIDDSSDINGLNVTVIFQVGNIDQPITVNTTLTRAR